MHPSLSLLVFIVLTCFKHCCANIREEDEKISKLFMDTVDPKRIEKFLVDLASKVHRAGTPESLSVADYIRQRFQDFGLKPVETEDYDVLLSYPNPEEPDQITLITNDGSKEFTISNGRSRILEASEKESKTADLRFLAFGKPGTAISTSLVYANFGRLEDFQYLQEQGVSVNGSVVIMRYGYTWRGTKVRLAEQLGALAVVLYSDPRDYHGVQNQNNTDTFPRNDHLPPTDAQRGSVVAEDSGDVLTPLLPAKEYVSRKSVDYMRDAGQLPDIPATVIGFGEAAKLFTMLEGNNAPDRWQGSLPVTYHLGGKFKTSAKIKVTVGGRLERRKIRNVIGYIQGTMEPDRYVILGNHHDAWTYGATDPSSGTAVLLEAARAFGALASQNNWKPRRTMLFCAWDAGEYGLIGSTEWVEQNLHRLQSRAVAYLNVDAAVTGHFAAFARGVPSLKEPLFEAARRTQNPNADEFKSGVKTVYDSWRKATKSHEPWVQTIVGSGSDYKPFLHYAGVPVMDISYGSFDRSYPLYHTLHDTIFFVKKYTDPTFVYHQAVCRLLGEAGRLLADSTIIPFNLDDMAKDLLNHFKDFDKRTSGTPYPFNVDLGPIASALDAFTRATHVYASKALLLSSEIVWSTDIEKRFAEIRMTNDRLVMLERFFIQPQGTPRRPSVRHTLYGPGLVNSQSGVLFPGIDTALEMSLAKNQLNDEVRSDADNERIVSEQISWVATCLNAAADWLNRDF